MHIFYLVETKLFLNHNIYLFVSSIYHYGASQVVSVVKNLPSNARDIKDMGMIPGTGRFPRGGPGNPLQYSCLENPMDWGAWLATVHKGAKTQL